MRIARAREVIGLVPRAGEATDENRGSFRPARHGTPWIWRHGTGYSPNGYSRTSWIWLRFEDPVPVQAVERLLVDKSAGPQSARSTCQGNNEAGIDQSRSMKTRLTRQREDGVAGGHCRASVRSLLEIFAACPAHRAHPILRDALKRRSGRDTILRVSLRWIIDIAAHSAHPLLHKRSSLPCLVHSTQKRRRDQQLDVSRFSRVLIHFRLTACIISPTLI
jgi:hypothetical protein